MKRFTLIAVSALALSIASPSFGDELYNSFNVNGWTFGGSSMGEWVMPTGAFLLDNGSFPDGSGRTVSGGNISGGWTVFQPFLVTGPGWNVTTIGVDGWNVLDPQGLGMLGTLLPDAAGTPDEGNPIASNTYSLATDPFNSNWRDEAFNVVLTPGMYWMMWEDNGDADHWSAIFNAPQGLASFSRTDAGSIFGSGPTALRIAGEEVPAPGALGLFVIGLGMTRRRRRRTA